MSINSRNKGAAFERKVCAELNGWLGCNARRRIAQYQSGGDDLEFIGDGAADKWLSRFSWECKNYRRVTDKVLAGFWEQATRQAPEGKQSIVVWKESRQPIRVTMMSPEFGCLVTMDFSDFLTYARGELA